MRRKAQIIVQERDTVERERAHKENEVAVLKEMVKSIKH